ncbi:MAG: polysaccharide biosynthesis/export family protein [Lacibacter sp.]
MRIYIFLFLALITSCIPSRKAILLSDISEGKDSISLTLIENSKIIYPGDRVTISILYPGPGEIIVEGVGSGAAQGGGGGQYVGYLVDHNGNIEVAGLGLIHVEGLTPQELSDYIKEKVSGLYKDVFVKCQLVGKILFLGGSGMQGSVPISNEQLNIIQALSLRGINDQTLRRDRVWVIRETKGIREYGLLDLTKKESYRSPFFYLRNNDIVYIEPGKTNTFLNVNAPVRNIFSIVSSSIALLFSLWIFFR